MTPETIIHSIAEATRIPIVEIKGLSRRVDIVRARHAAMYLLRRHTDLSYPKIGRLFHRDHTTVMHAVASIEAARRANPRLADFLDQLVA